jgi:hypothetical protein
MDLDALAARYAEITPEQEAELLKRLNDEGWEPGCWIRPDAELIVRTTQPEVDSFLEEMRMRKNPQRGIFADHFPDGLPRAPIEGDAPCYIVLSQRCDIVNTFTKEPLIELAPANVCTDQQRIDNGWRNSPREFPVDPRENPTHLVDLRYRFFISKLDVLELPLRQALAPDDPEYRVRERFVLRVGQRYTRAAVPEELVVKVAGPLRDQTKNNSELNALFYEWAFYHGGKRSQPPGIIAVYRIDVDESLDQDERAEQEHVVRQRAEDMFQTVIDQLPADAKALLDLDDERTYAVSETEHPVAKWRQSWKLEWDDESFGGDPDAAVPAR